MNADEGAVRAELLSGLGAANLLGLVTVLFRPLIHYASNHEAAAEAAATEVDNLDPFERTLGKLGLDEGPDRPEH